MLGLTESMVKTLFPKMKHQVKFLHLREKLKHEQSLEQDNLSAAACRDGDPGTPDSTDQPSASPNAWTSHYPLPAFPPRVINALDQKDPLFKSSGKSTARSQIIQILFDDLSKDSCWYPTHKMYTDVMDALCTKYPFLRDSSSSGYSTLLSCLKNKYKKERRPLTSVDAIKQAKERWGTVGTGRKRKAEGDGDGEHLAKKARKSVVLNEEGEDEHSIKQHFKIMDKEMAKTRPNMGTIRDLMSRTAPARSKMMEGQDTADTLASCPYLKIPSLMLHEMEICYGVPADASLRAGIDRFSAAITKKAKKCPLREKMQACIDEELDEKQKQGLQRCASILLLPGLFKESDDLLFSVNKDPQHSTPTLFLDGAPGGNPLKAQRMSIWMDGVEIVKDDHSIDVISGIATMISAYFVYGVHYPKKLKNTLTFIEKYLLGLKSADKNPVTVDRMHDCLSS